MTKSVSFLLIICIISYIRAELIEVSTPKPSELSTLNLTEHELVDKNSQSRAILTHSLFTMFPIYSPETQRNSTEVTKTETVLLTIVKKTFQIVRNVFTYLIIRYFTVKLFRLFDLLLGIKEALVPDDASLIFTKAAVRAMISFINKLGDLLLGKAGIVILTAFVASAVCYFTPACFEYFPYDFRSALDHNTMRSLLTPEKLMSATNLVNNAIEKYERLQRFAEY